MSSDSRFKKGYSLVVRDGYDLETYLPAIARAGFDGVEPTFVSGALPAPDVPFPHAREQAKRLRAVCSDLGLAIPSMRGGRVPWGTIPSDSPQERQRGVDHVGRACELLAEMGGSVVLVVPGERNPGVDYDTHWARVVEFAHRAAERARETGVRIGFENVEARFPVSVRDWCHLIDEISDPAIGVYLDVGNVIWMGFGYPEHWIRRLGDRIVQVHFKDARYRLHGATLHSEIHHILDGDVDWPAVMTALDDIAYRGWVSVEPEAILHLRERLPVRLASDLKAILSLPETAATEEHQR